MKDIRERSYSGVLNDVVRRPAAWSKSTARYGELL